MSDAIYPLADGAPPQVKVESRATYQHVALTGDLDSFAAEPIRRRLEELVDTGGHGRLVIDLAECPFVDSAGLGTLVAIYKRCQVRGGPEAALVLLHPSPELSELLRMTQLDTHLLCFASLDAARVKFPWIEPAEIA